MRARLFVLLTCTHAQTVYMDSFRLENSDRELQNNHVMSCVNFLRTHPMYKQAGLVYIPENAPGSRGGELAYVLRNVANSITMSEFGQDKRPGVPKDKVRTANMINRMRIILNTDSWQFAHDMGAFIPLDGTRTRAEAAAAMIDEVCSQLLAFRIDEHGKWSGKNGISGRDDSAVAMIMQPYWMEALLDSSDYAPFRLECNRRLLRVPTSSS